MTFLTHCLTSQQRCRFPTKQVFIDGRPFFSFIYLFLWRSFSYFFLQCIEVVPDMTEERVAKIMETPTRDAAAA